MNLIFSTFVVDRSLKKWNLVLKNGVVSEGTGNILGWIKWQCDWCAYSSAVHCCLRDVRGGEIL